jgi:hypothetical protein
LSDRLQRIKEAHPDFDPAYPQNLGKTSMAVITKIQEDFGCRYPEEFLSFQLVDAYHIPMGDHFWDGFGWANLDLDPYMNLYLIVQDARGLGVPEHLAPFREENGDYFCFDSRDPAFPVVLWDHNQRDLQTNPVYRWPDFYSWLEASFI